MSHLCLLQAVTDHAGYILSWTRSFVGSASDKTICKFDLFLKALRTVPLFLNFRYAVFARQGAVKILKGVYLICDGGYLKWRILQCGNKHPSDIDDHYYSENIASVRKDIECVFGRLKRRWRWLLNGTIELRCREDIDNAVMMYVYRAVFFVFTHCLSHFF